MRDQGLGSKDWVRALQSNLQHLASNIKINEPLGRYTTSSAKILPLAKPALPHGVKLLPAVQVQDAVILNAGARPWDRDKVDSRIVADTIEGRGKIIDSEEEVGGFPDYKETRQAFSEKDWDLQTMTPKIAPTTRYVPK